MPKTMGGPRHRSWAPVRYPGVQYASPKGPAALEGVGFPWLNNKEKTPGILGGLESLRPEVRRRRLTLNCNKQDRATDMPAKWSLPVPKYVRACSRTVPSPHWRCTSCRRRAMATRPKRVCSCVTSHLLPKISTVPSRRRAKSRASSSSGGTGALATRTLGRSGTAGYGGSTTSRETPSEFCEEGETGGGVVQEEEEESAASILS